MDKIIEILKQVRPDVDYAKETALIDDKILDSFDIVSIIGELTDAFDVEIHVEDMTPENFNSAASIHALVQRLQDEE